MLQEERCVDSRTRYKNRKCSPGICEEDDDDKKLECTECDKLFHYSCTGLPLHQLAHFMTKGYRKYICVSCTTVPEYLKGALGTTEEIGDGEINEENDLTNAELARVNDSLTAQKKENLRLVKCMDTASEENRSQAKRITDLEEENKKLEYRLKGQANVITSLRNKTPPATDGAPYAVLTKKLDDTEALLKKKTKEVQVLKGEEHAPESFINMETIINDRLDDIQSKIESSIEKLITKKLTENITSTKHQDEGVASVTEIQGSPWNRPPPAGAVNLRAIMKETQNEQLNEANDQKVRARNLIIHGVAEDPNAEKVVAKQHDEAFVQKLLGAMTISDLTFKTVHRIGKPQPDKKRPLMVMMNSEADKERIMSSLTNLKDQEDYKGISVTEDYTITERQLLNDWREKAKAKNKEEGEDSRYIWRVRGTPKNGLTLKRLPKQRQASQVV